MKTKKVNFFKRKFETTSISTKITLVYGLIFSIFFTIFSILFLFNIFFYHSGISRKELEETTENVTNYVFLERNIKTEDLYNLKSGKYIEIRIINMVEDLEYSTFSVEDYNKILELEAKGKANQDFELFRYRKKNEIILENNNTNFHINFNIVEDKNTSNYASPKEYADNQSKIPFFVNTLTLDENTKYLFYEKRLNVRGENFTIQIFKNDAGERNILDLLICLFIIFGVIGFFGVFLVSKHLSKVLLKPINIVIETAESITIEDLGKRIEVNGANDEIKKMATAFNEMIERIEDSFIKQNRFISDASHELRTPISVIQGYANLIDRWGKRDPEILQESIDAIKAETEHMTILIKKFLILATQSKNTTKIKKENLDLNSVIEDAIKSVNIIDPKKKVYLEELSKEKILGDYDLIKQLVLIFVENSFKYSKKNETFVTIKVYNVNKQPVISIKDNGTGMLEEDLSHIFERFYRADKSRSKEIAGTGLGLSIADMIIKQHNGKIQVFSTFNEGSEFIISFPKIPQLLKNKFSNTEGE